MAKKSSFKNMFLTLLLICFGGSAILGGVYLLTHGPIEAAQTAKVNRALMGVLPEFDNTPSEECFEMDLEGQVIKAYPALFNGEPVGWAVEVVTTRGFGGPIQIMVGFLPDGTIFNSALISHSETPGLGDKLDAEKSDFSTQFKGKHPATFTLAVKKDGGMVDAITAATISSRAFCHAMEVAYKAFQHIATQEGGKV